MSGKVGRILLHSVGAATMLYGYKSLGRLGNFDEWIRSQYGGHSQYLTIDGLFCAIFVMLLGLLGDLFPPQKPHSKSVDREASNLVSRLTQLKRLVLLVALPVSVVVATVYWLMILFMPHLMLSDALATEPTVMGEKTLFRIPLDIDLALHGFPGPFLLLDFFLYEEKFSKTTMDQYAPVLATLVSVFYASWVEYCASYNNIFPYPFLTLSPLPGRIAIYIGCTVFAVTMVRFVNWLHR